MQGALLLTEVLRERDKQVDYKRKQQEMYKHIDELYLKQQEEVTEKFRCRFHTLSSSLLITILFRSVRGVLWQT